MLSYVVIHNLGMPDAEKIVKQPGEYVFVFSDTGNLKLANVMLKAPSVVSIEALYSVFRSNPEQCSWAMCDASPQDVEVLKRLNIVTPNFMVPLPEYPSRRKNGPPNTNL